MKKVFIVIADKNYLEHAKYLFYSAKNVGKWTGDLLLVANNVDDELLTNFIDFGVEIFKINSPNFYYANFYIFHTFFKKWDFVMYMDCDFTIFSDLDKLIEYENFDNSVLYVDIEPFRKHEYFCQGWDLNKKNESLKFLTNKYDLEQNGFNAGFMYFSTNLIEKNTLDNLFLLCNEIQFVNNHTSPNGSDQPIFNLYFDNKTNYIKNKKISFWSNSDENTIAQHHCRWDAPWTNNTFSTKLQKTYTQNYKDNLKNFYVSINKI